MAKGDIIVIKKKKGGGHGGHHGGAWKVAYADFVTAMMAFFLVMWLMGSDEETKAAISHYFNHPNTPFKDGRDPNSKEVHPLGESEGTGPGMMAGMAGLWPEDLLDRPKPVRDVMKEHKTISQMLEDLLEGQIYGLDVTQEHVRFSLPEHLLFEPGSSLLSRESREHLDVLGKILGGFKGFVTITGHTDEAGARAGENGAAADNNWELSFGRALSVMRYLKASGVKEEAMVPQGAGARRPYASNKDPGGRARNRRVEFTLSYKQPE